VWCDIDEVSRYVHFRDVSLTGARLETLLPLDVGALTRMRWGQEDEDIAVSARVVWTAPGEEGTICVGLAFEQVDTPEPLTKFIHRRENNLTCALASSPTSTPTSKR
jgi:hypothetical protein